MQLLASLKIASQGFPKGLAESEHDAYVDQINQVRMAFFILGHDVYYYVYSRLMIFLIW